MLPLSDLKVLDLSRVLAGPFATMLLGDLGADIIKVEQPGRGDDTRHWGPPFAGGESAYFLAINRNKRAITADLKHPPDLEGVLELATKANILIENFRRGTQQTLKIDYESIRSRNPQIIYCPISIGTLETVGSPILVDGERLPIRLPPPLLGQHNGEVGW
jgi:crotonobetainyl-CoA:carnitine CoA-transferase CaiB-like acyl-CoA transferase